MQSAHGSPIVTWPWFFFLHFTYPLPKPDFLFVVGNTVVLKVITIDKVPSPLPKWKCIRTVLWHVSLNCNKEHVSVTLDKIMLYNKSPQGILSPDTKVYLLLSLDSNWIQLEALLILGSQRPIVPSTKAWIVLQHCVGGTVRTGHRLLQHPQEITQTTELTSSQNKCTATSKLEGNKER